MTHPTRRLLTLLLAFGLIAALPLDLRADDEPTKTEEPDAKPDEPKSDEAKSDEEKSDEAKSDGAKEEAKRRPLLWMVEGSPRVFLYGTIHIPDARVTKHLPVVQAAFDQSTALYCELELDMAGQMKMQQEVMSMAPLPAGKTLKGVLGDDLYKRVEGALPSGMPPLQMFGGFKPWLVQFLLSKTLIDEHQKAEAKKNPPVPGPSNLEGDGPATQGLDPMLYAQAQKAGKQVGGLETIRSQISVFDSLSLETQAELVKSLMDEIDKIRKPDEAKGENGEAEVDGLTKLVDLWLAGDTDGFLKIFEEELKKQGGPEAKKFVEGLLDNRNVDMVKKIQELMKAYPDKTFFMAVGAGHMPGEKGMVNLMRQAGFTVRRMELGDKLPALPHKTVEKKPEPAKEPAGTGG